MSFCHLPILIDIEGDGSIWGGVSSEVAVRFFFCGLFCCFQGAFSVRMRNHSGVVLWLPLRTRDELEIEVMEIGTNVIGDGGVRRGIKNGVTRIHGSKGNFCLCQTVAGEGTSW